MVKFRYFTAGGDFNPNKKPGFFPAAPVSTEGRAFSPLPPPDYYVPPGPLGGGRDA